MKNNLFTKIIITLTIIVLMGLGCYRILINEIFNITGENLSQLEIIEDEPNKKLKQDIKPKQNEKPKTEKKHNTKDKTKQTKPSQKSVQQTNKTSGVTFEDKRRAVKLISSKLSAKDINYLISLFRGGLTPEKKRQAVKLAQERYSPEEIKEIRALYHKYIKNLR